MKFLRNRLVLTPLIALSLAGAFVALRPRKAEAYDLFVVVREPDHYVKFCWSFIDPLKQKHTWCSGWMSPENG